MNRLGRVFGAVKNKILYIVLGHLARDIAEGKKGPKLQAYYLWSRGKKTVTGLFLFLIFSAVTTFAPPYTETFFGACAVVSGCLMALGLIDASWNNKPAFPFWFLESLKRISAVLTTFHGALIPLTELVHVLYPSGDAYLHQVVLVEAAVMTATAFVNRYAAASLAPPPQMVPKTSITGEFSLSEVVEAVKNAPLVPEQRMERRGVESDSAGKKDATVAPTG
jgi:hypothetical protein